MSDFITHINDNKTEHETVRLDPPPVITSAFSRRGVLKAAVTTGSVLPFLSGAGLLSITAGSTLPLLSGPALAASAPSAKPTGTAIVPFRIAIAQSDLDDLRARLALTRWPEKETVQDWSQGVPLAKAQALIAAWHDHYDWRAFERRVNQIPQFLTNIDGLDIHFIHVKSAEPNALPILLTHGWPGSFSEFLEVVGPLTDPVRHGGKASDAFDVIIPSLPGYAFSAKPTAPGWNIDKTAATWVKLMDRLGYERWVAQGGDWGASVTSTLGQLRPEGLAGIHLNWAFVFPEVIPEKLSPDEKRAVDQANVFKTEGIGYFKQLSTKPQTMGYGLLDSPVALATYIYEKFQVWSDNKGDPEEAISLTAMLDDISLYWLTRSGASAARFYWENPGNSFAGGIIDVPVAVSVFPREIYQVPKSWAEATFPKLIYFGEVEKGGHFAALEQPKLFTEELRRAFTSLRS
ncbi:epoxide hydrolase family protein [Pseudomonas sp. TMB3-21]